MLNPYFRTPKNSSCISGSSSFGRAPSFQVGGGRFEPCYSLILSFSITVVQVFLVHLVGVRIPEGQLKFLTMNMLIAYYIICVVYCFYQLNKKYRNRGVDYGTSPELDSIMVLVMAWVLAPIDVSITWIRMVKEAEEAKRRQEKQIL